MRIGISLSSSRPPGDPQDGARSIIARAERANAVELDAIVLGDHHARPTPYFQNVPMLGRLMAEVDSTRPMGCLFLLPLWNPVLLAEQVATLAAMSDAPFIIQTGIGSGAQQFAAMGGSLRDRGRVLEESIRVIKALLAGDVVDSERLGITEAVISPTPDQDVEWWIGAGVDQALERAARLGDAWYTSPSYTPAELDRPMRAYEAFCARQGNEPRTVLRKDVLVLRDGDRARRSGANILDGGYRGMGEDSLIIGGIDDAVRQVRAFGAMGVSDVMIRCMSVDDSIALETIECFGEVRRLLADSASHNTRELDS